jgi:hypothetical protein
VVFGNTAFGSFTDYVEVDPAAYTFVVTVAGSTDEVFVFEPITLQSGVTYTVVAHGTLSATDAYPFAVRAFVDNDAGNGFADFSFASAGVTVIHASPDAPGVDLLLDGAVVNSSPLTFPNNTGYLPVNAGTRNVKVNAAGSDLTVIDANLGLAANQSYSVFAVNYLSSIEPLVLVDNLATPAPGTAHVRFIHLSPDAPTVDITLADGATVFDDVSFKENTGFTPLAAGSYDLEVRDETGTVTVLALGEIMLETGKIYTVFASGLLNGSGGETDPGLGAEIIVNK